MKIIHPTPMMKMAAEAIEPVKDHVAVLGAAAVQIAVGKSTTAITPTTDVDMGLVERGALEATVDEVVAALRSAKLEPSDVEHERGFTWVSDAAKIQLVRGFTPFPKGKVKRLPVQPGIEDFFDARQPIAFDDSPEVIRFWCTDPASLIGLKERAFGRERGDGERVVRDYVDAHLLMRFALDEIVELWPGLNGAVKGHALKACETLSHEDSDAVNLGAPEMVTLGLAPDALTAAADMRRAAARMIGLVGERK